MWTNISKMLKRGLTGVVLGAWALSTALSHQAPGKIDFRRDVQPLFRQYCIECHGPSQQMHGFRLDRRREAMRGGTTTVIAPGNSAASRLYLKLIGSQYGQQMPPTGALSPEQCAIIKDWIDQGAQWPDELAGDVPVSPPDPKAARIMAALRDGDQLAFAKLARQDSQIGNRKGPGGTTPLMQAVLYGDSDSVRLLLANHADPNLRNDAGATALMWAVDDPEKTRLLLEHGADVNARSDDGSTPLLIATGQFGASEVVKLLLSRGANLLVKSPIINGYSTPLSEAARTCNDALLRMLIERGADVKGAGFQPLTYGYSRDTCLCRAPHKHVYAECGIMPSEVGERAIGVGFIIFYSA
ncbi:MAG: ankyrin repeat domain-containing protein [Acidobacteria bacterium]|nr:ankyrin repeat domain-containing protein [Acidobacteriota bacterium]